MSSLDAPGQPPVNRKSKTRIKLGVYLILVVCLLTSFIYLANAAGTNVTGLTVTPNPIKLGYTASISYTLGQDSKVNITIYKESGELVRNILTNTAKLAGANKSVWDGKDNGSVLVPDGRYKIVVESLDDTGAQTGLMEQLVVAARSPAMSNITDTPDPFNPLNGEKSRITYTISSDANVTVTILRGSIAVVTIPSAAVKPAGTYTFEWDGTDGTGVVADGSYYYQLDAVSPTVSTFKSTFRGTTVVEKEPPQVTALSVTQNPLKLGVASQFFKFTLSENAAVTTKVYDSQNNLVRTVTDAQAKIAGAVSIVWDGKNDAGQYVPEGQYTGVINAVDNYAKSSGDQSIPFTAGYQPAITDAAVAPNPYNPVDGSAAINYNISQDALVTVKILSGTTEAASVVANQAQKAGHQTITWDGQTLGDGSYTLQVTAVSPTVAAFSSTVKVPFSIAGSPLNITDFSLTPDPYKIGVGSLSIKYTLSESATVNVRVYQGSTTIRNVATGESKNAGAVTSIWDGKDGAGSYVPEGVYSVSVNATDASGNLTEVSGTITAGYLPAISGVTAPQTFDPATGAAPINFTLSRDAKVTLTILQGSAVVKTFPAAALKSGPNTLSWDGKDDVPQQVSDGPYTFQMDAASPLVPTFKSTYRGTVTLESADPVLSGLSVTPSTVKIGSNAFFKYTVSEPATTTARILKAADRSEVKLLPPNVRTSGGTSTVSWDTKDNSGILITAGNYIVEFTAVDNFSKTGSAELPFSAGAAPVISSVYATPASVDLAQGSSVTFNYTISENSLVTVRVFDASNVLIKTIYTSKAMPTGPGTAVWDCANAKGETVKGTFTFKIDAASVIGSLRAVQASGTVDVSGSTVVPPPTSGTCTDCHNNYPLQHPMNNCDACHGNNVPIEDCSQCHGGTHDYGVLTSYECTYCHNETYSYKVPYHEGDINVLHTAPLTADCQKCHNAALNVEHPLHTNDAGQAFNCNTCHQSTVTEVVYAIANKQKDCNACHAAETVSTTHESNHTAPGITADCAKCHINSLTTEHLNNPTTQAGNSWTCSTCHSSTVANVVYAIDNSISSCSACHSAANHDAVHTPTGINTGCLDCHLDSLTQEHLNNPTTQTGNSWTCATCHSSTVSAVVYAIDNNLKNCDACHSASGHSQVHDTNNLDSNCTTCHNNNLSYEHLQNEKTQLDAAGNFSPKNCNTCHASAEPTVAGAVYTSNTQCAACHRTGHNMTFMENVPAYVYKYPGFDWTPPQDALLWEGESWMPSEYVLGGKVIISNRRPATAEGVVDTVSGPVFDYYNTRLTADNWALVSPGPAKPNYFEVTYKKGTHQQTIWFYGGATHEDSTVLDSGYRIEVIYK